MMHGFKGKHGHHSQMSGHGDSFSRHFLSMKEKEEHLQEYKKQLENELAGVEQHIKHFKEMKKT